MVLVAVVVAVAVGALQSSVAHAVLRGTLALLLVLCAVIDFRWRIIPNRITGPGVLLGLGLGVAIDLGGEPERLLAAVIAGGLLLVAALVRPAGMGMGDVKLLFVMALFLGRSVAVALLVALIANLLTGVVLAFRVGVRAARKTELPFGPYLAAGGVLAALVGDQIMRAYLHAH